MFESQFLKNLRITPKFILWFLFIALVPLAIATYVSYNSSREVLEEEVANSLLAVADNKANLVKVFLRDKENDITTLSHTSDIIEAFEKLDLAFAENGENIAAFMAVEQKYRPFLEYYQNLFGYDDLFLIRPNGDILFAAQKKPEKKSLYEMALYEPTELAKAFIKAKDSLTTEISDFEYDPKSKTAAVFIASPVFKGAGLVGVIIGQMSNKGVSELVSDYTGLGQTGETAIVAKTAQRIVFITPLRFDPDAAFAREIKGDSAQGQQIEQALKGQEGLGAFVDYRGQKVLNVRRYLSSFRWGIIVKIDTSEIFASARRLRNTLGIISLLLAVVVVVMAVVIARSVSSPIKELTNTSVTIASGDLSARAKIGAKDEIGELAQSFNKMTDSLVEAKANVERQKAQIEEQKKLLEKANKELDSFVYTASHDLRAPLRAIASFTGFLEEDYKEKLDEEGRDYLKEIRQGANRMSNLIEDLLKLSRISRIKNPFETVNLNDLIDTVIKRIEFDIKEKKVDMRIQQDMPDIICDRIKMSELILNLINNAIKFSSKNNKEAPRVEIGYIDEGRFHRFYVKDNGIGIDPKYHNQIFGIFKRLHTNMEYEGTGAGLSIVKRVVDDHKGEIWVESEIGKGAAFQIRIPKDIRKKKKPGEVLIRDGLIDQKQPKDKLNRQNGESGPPPYTGKL
ncbi:MAG: HAMP domain-containing protein [Candidatus Omnitrophica bacterium]|nr:HAMP domain-containing protein [Candidatus Omnitrophota bacterium]